ncbi:MAG: DUF1800 domain-containing protein [Rubrivivax sp.]|nr:DUF1800 domain-containing protein [Rubrivivax sp.]
MSHSNPNRAATARGLPLACALAVLGLVATVTAQAQSQTQAQTQGHNTALGALSPPGSQSTAAAEASRLLHQASFGPNAASLAEVQRLGSKAWIAAQWNQPRSSVRALQAQSWNLRGNDPYNRYLDIHTGIWTAAIDGRDQLRQRVTWGLSQIFVINVLNSDPPLSWAPEAVADWWDMLAANADGNFRTLIEGVARHPMMGLYLSHLANQKEDPDTGRLPDQNFARELLQLFTIGLFELNPDGTPKRNAQGQPIESYTGADVAGLAKVFTGWSFDAGPGVDRFWSWNFYDNTMPASAFRAPMRLYPEHHSPSDKQFLGITVPAALGGEAALTAALDRIVAHPNVGPFIGRQLIQRMVTSNPDPGYVARVAAVFANNGSGVRGDMKAVINAVLLDPEARNRTTASLATFGRLKEPVLRVTNFYRAIEARPGQYGWNFWWNWGDDGLGQAPLSSPSVFNYYRPGFSPAGTSIAAKRLVAPEMQITNEVTTIAWAQQVRDMLRYADNYPAATPLALSRQVALAGDPDALVEHLDTVFAGRLMSPRTRGLLREAIASVPMTEPGAAWRRAGIGLALTMSSTDFLVQK